MTQTGHTRAACNNDIGGNPRGRLQSDICHHYISYIKQTVLRLSGWTCHIVLTVVVTLSHLSQYWLADKVTPCHMSSCLALISPHHHSKSFPTSDTCKPSALNEGFQKTVTVTLVLAKPPQSHFLHPGSSHYQELAVSTP